MHSVGPDYIPGTDFIIAEQGNQDGLLKHGNIVLVPQPTVSPNDPLTWSAYRKYIHLALLLLITGLTAATSNAISSAQDGIQKEHPYLSTDQFNTGDGVLFFGIGWWTLFSAPAVYLYGSRIGYLLSMIISIVGNVWFANVTNVGDLIVSQMFVGASEAVCEAVVQLSITQVFFQHQANHYIGFYVLAISIGTFLGPLIGSFVADDINWHWVGYVGAICSGFILCLIFFGLEETYFDRAHFQSQYDAAESQALAHDYEMRHMNDSANDSFHEPFDDDDHTSKAKKAKAGNDSELLARKSVRGGSIKEASINEGSEEDGLEKSHSTTVKPHLSRKLIPERTLNSIRPDIVDEEKQAYADPPKSYWQRIALITPAVNLKGTGFKQYIKRLFLYLQVLAFPPVIYSGFQWGAQDAWLSFYIDLEDDYWYGPPWNYSDEAVGIMNIPCLIGATVGCVYGAWFSDWFVLMCAKRNGGIREAESRLWCLIPAGLISPAGMFLLGVGTKRGWWWPAPYVGLGMIGFGWGCCGDLSMSYLVDCYPEMVLEGMVGVSLINNNIAAVFSFVVDRWMNSIGPQNTMISIGVLNFFFIFLSVPMIIFGKRCRKLTRNMYFRFVEARDGLDKS